MKKINLFSTFMLISAALLAYVTHAPQSVSTTKHTKPPEQHVSNHYQPKRLTACDEKTISASGSITSHETQNQSGTFTLQ